MLRLWPMPWPSTSPIRPPPSGPMRLRGWTASSRLPSPTNVDLDAAVASNDAVIAAYATRSDRPDFPFWPMLFANLTIRLFGSDDFPAAAKQQAAADLTAAAQDGDLSIPIGTPLPLEQVAEAHDPIDAGARDRVLLRIPD
jgi:NADPH:quinone reductase